MHVVPKRKKEGEKEREIHFKELAPGIVGAGEEDVCKEGWKPSRTDVQVKRVFPSSGNLRL